MKKTFIMVLAAALSLAAAVSCTKENKEETRKPETPEQTKPEEPVAEDITLHIVPSLSPLTHTYIDGSADGSSYSPSWNNADALAVWFGSLADSRIKFTNSSANGAAADFSATFSGVSGEQTAYAVYPYAAFAAADDAAESVTLTVSAEQNPAGFATFDPACDILVGKPETVTVASGATLELQFTRVLAVVRVEPYDDAAGSPLASAEITSVSMSASSATLAGSVTVALADGSTSWADAKKSVTATYDAASPLKLGTAASHANAVYFLVNPALLEKGSTLDFSFYYGSNVITKQVTISDDIQLYPGVVTTFKVKTSDTAASSKLIAPADGAGIVLSVDAQDATTTFSWDGTGQSGTDYSIVFSLSDDLASPQAVALTGVSGATAELTADAIQTAVEQLDIKRFVTNTVYWNVRNDATGEFISATPNSAEITDMLRFTDSRAGGAEVNQYRVVKLTYDGSDHYWLAENLRTKYDADGNALTEFADYRVMDSKPASYNNYYTLSGAEKACPKGWTLPTEAEWKTLFNAALNDGGSFIVLKSKTDYKPINYAAEKADTELWGAWGLDLVSAGIWWGNTNGVDTDNSQHIFLVAKDIVRDGNSYNFFGQSAADGNFFVRTDSNANCGAPARYYYSGK